MTVKVTFKNGKVVEFEKVDKFAQAPGVMHLININAQPIAFIPLDAVDFIRIPEHETDIQIYN